LLELLITLAVIATFFVIAMSLIVGYSRLSVATRSAVALDTMKRLLTEYIEHKNDPVSEEDLSKALSDADFDNVVITNFSRTTSHEDIGLSGLYLYTIEFGYDDLSRSDSIYVSKYEP